MPVLLLAQGEPAAKNLLRQAIEARYGARPPALDSLILDLKGRAKIKLGPVTTWVPVDARAYFRFPTAMRWDFTVRPLKMPVQRGIDAYDGERCRTVRGGKPANVLDNPDQIHSMRSRLWAIAAVLLTPLSETFVKLTVEGDRQFRAANTQLNDSALISLRDNHKLDQVQVRCVNPDTAHQQAYTIRLSDELVTLDGLILPEKFNIAWDDAQAVELHPVTAKMNPIIPDEIFRLEESAYV